MPRRHGASRFTRAFGSVPAILALAGARTVALAAPAGEIQATAAFAVARDPSGQKAAAHADARLRARAAKIRELRIIDPARVLSGDPRTREEETLDRARAALADGRRAYDALKLDDAIARLGQAVSLYQQTGPLLGDMEELETALAHLGAALGLRGSKDEAESVFVELLTIDDAYQLKGFPPTVERMFEAALARIEKAPTGSVEVYSTPPYAAVYLDGRFVGITPITIDEVTAGTHYLRIERIGYTVHGAPLEIAANQKISSQSPLRNVKRGAELRDLTARCAEELMSEGMGGSLRSLARELVADTVIFVGVTQSGQDATFTGAVFDAASGTRLTTERAVIGTASPSFESELDQLIDRLLGVAQGGPNATSTPNASGGGGASAFGLGGTGASSGASTAAPSSTASPPTAGQAVTRAPNETPGEVYLGWTLIGVGAAALTTGVVFGILSSTVHSDFRASSQASPDLGHLKDIGETDALVADLCFLGGGLSAIGGIVILLVASSREPTPAELLSQGGLRIGPMAGGVGLGLGGSF